jgi:hypothetical protein
MGFLFGTEAGILTGENGIMTKIGQARSDIGQMQAGMGINSSLSRASQGKKLMDLLKPPTSSQTAQTDAVAQGLIPNEGTQAGAISFAQQGLQGNGVQGAANGTPFDYMPGAVGMLTQNNGGWQNPVTGQVIGTQAAAPAGTQAMNYWRKNLGGLQYPGQNNYTFQQLPFGDWFRGY